MDIQELTQRIDSLITELVAIKSLISATSSQFPNERMDLVSQGICLFCEEKIVNQRAVRGCHERCYRKLERAFSSGETTEEAAITSGVLLPKGRVGRKSSKDVAAKIESLTKVESDVKELEQQLQSKKRKPKND